MTLANITVPERERSGSGRKSHVFSTSGRNLGAILCMMFTTTTKVSRMRMGMPTTQSTMMVVLMVFLDMDMALSGLPEQVVPENLAK